jgi:hypothetical protein
MHLLLTVQFAFGASLATNTITRSPLLILIDGFTDYISGECRSYCSKKNIEIIELISPYMCEILQRQQNCEVPAYLQAPVQDDQVVDWWNQLSGADDHSAFLSTCVLAESDSGVSTAEKIADVLNLRGNGLSPHLRNKFESNVRAQNSGLKSVKQTLAYTVHEALEFVKELWSVEDSIGIDKRCIVKPYR